MTGELCIAGIGPGPAGLVSEAAKRAILGAEKAFVQTRRHPAVPTLIEMGAAIEPLDELYENARDFDVLNDALIRTVIQSAKIRRTVLALNGHGLTGQAAVADMIHQARESGIPTTVCPSVGMEAAAVAAAKLDASAGYAVYAGWVRALNMDTDVINVVLDIDTKLKAGELKIELMKRYADDETVYVVQADDRKVACHRIILSELDRQDGYDAFTALVLPARPLLLKRRYSAAHLMEICRILRSPNGCPWDREQTHFSIRRNMMEECCEAMAAISEGDDAHLCEELGDVLLQVALHAQMAQEEGTFDFLDITTAICQKLIRRHPHVFAQEKVESSEDVMDTWERIKSEERNGEKKNPLIKVGEGLPALMRSQQLQKRMHGAVEDGAGIQEALYKAIDGVANSTDTMQAEARAGEALWLMALVLHAKDVHAETALHDHCTSEVSAFMSKGAYDAKNDDEI